MPHALSWHEAGISLTKQLQSFVFLLPLAGTKKSHGSQFDVTEQAAMKPEAFAAELDVARRLFIAFFVESVILDIHGEDEIWFLESGPDGERLYVLARERPDQPRSGKRGTEQLELSIPSSVETWLRESGYEDVANDIAGIVEDWRKNGVKTRRNWWAVLAGDKNGRSRAVAGVSFPVIAAIRRRQGLPPAAGAITRPNERSLPPKERG